MLLNNSKASSSGLAPALAPKAPYCGPRMRSNQIQLQFCGRLNVNRKRDPLLYLCVC